MYIHLCIYTYIYIYICIHIYIYIYIYGRVRFTSILPCSLQKIQNEAWWKPLRTCLKKCVLLWILVGSKNYKAGPIGRYLEIPWAQRRFWVGLL